MPADLRAHVRYPEKSHQDAGKSSASTTPEHKGVFPARGSLECSYAGGLDDQGKKAAQESRSVFCADAIARETIANEFGIICRLRPPAETT